MTEYEKNTVGWWLSQLKEPLRSRALTNTLEEKALAAPIAGMWEAIHLAFPWSDTPEGQGFWAGVHNFFQGQGRKPNRRAGVVDGYDMAKECAPDPEVVNPPLTNEQQSFQVEVVEIPVVHDYTPPRPVETIEGRHEREINEMKEQIYAMQETIKWLTQNLQEHTHSDYDGNAQMSI